MVRRCRPQDTRLSDTGGYTHGHRCTRRLNRHDQAGPIGGPMTRVQFSNGNREQVETRDTDGDGTTRAAGSLASAT